MAMSWDQNAGKNHNIKVDNKSFERVDEFKYLGTILMKQNSIQEKIKTRLNSENTCYQSVQNPLSSCLLSKDIKMKIYRSIILLVVLYGCETWSFTLREESRLRVFENRVLRRIFGPRREEATGEWRRLHNDLYCSPNTEWSNQEEWDRQGTYNIWGRGEAHTGFWWGNLRERDHLEDPDIYCRIILKSIFRKWEGGMD